MIGGGGDLCWKGGVRVGGCCVWRGKLRRRGFVLGGGIFIFGGEGDLCWGHMGRERI